MEFENDTWDKFNKNFLIYKSKKMLLYGIGDNTKIILKKAADYNIIGLLDGCKKDGEMYGLPILNEAEFEEESIDIIVIIARASNVKIIFRRIESICKDLGIKVFDINGTDLFQRKVQRVRNESYYNVCEKELIDIIDKAEVISFDIFDTLIMRKTLLPTDVFELMEIRYPQLPKDFAKNREAAERMLNLQKKAPSIYDIYEYLMEQNVLDKPEDILELEYQTDCDCIIRREKIYSIFRYCIEQGKSVYLISDMYYTKKMLINLLDNEGIKEYKDILISSDLKTAKSGELFKRFLEIEPDKKKLHIGDDEDADRKAAEKYKIDTFIIKSARDMLEISTYEEALSLAATVMDRLALGSFAAIVFNDPFALYQSGGKGKVETYRDLGYCFIAPVIMHFVIWLINKLQEKQYDGIMFSARDGYIMKQVYEYISGFCRDNTKLPEAVYLYASRMAYVIMSILSDDDIKFAFDLAFDGTPEEMLSGRYRLSREDIKPYNHFMYSGEADYIMEHRNAIFKKAEIYRENFKKYWSDHGLSGMKKIAFFDFVSSGTCQNCLQNVIDAQIEGYYFSYIRSKTTVKRIKVSGLYNNDIELDNSYFINDNYLFLENILTSYEPTLKEFDKEGLPVFLNENRTEKQLKEIKEIHDSIMDYTKNLLYLTKGNINYCFSQRVADKLLEFIQNRYSKYDTKINHNEILLDEFCRRQINVSEIWE